MCRLRHANLGWHIGGHPAPLRHEGFEGYRGHQQGQGGAHLSGG